jgi:hypothetical protein
MKRFKLMISIACSLIVLGVVLCLWGGNSSTAQTPSNDGTPTDTPTPTTQPPDRSEKPNPKKGDGEVTILTDGGAVTITSLLPQTPLPSPVTITSAASDGSTASVAIPVGSSGTFVYIAQGFPNNQTFTSGCPTDNGASLAPVAILVGSGSATGQATYTIFIPGTVTGSVPFTVSCLNSKTSSISTVGLNPVSPNYVVIGTGETTEITVASEPAGQTFPRRPVAALTLSQAGVGVLQGTLDTTPTTGITFKAGSLTGVATVTVSEGTSFSTTTISVVGAAGSIQAIVPSPRRLLHLDLEQSTISGHHPSTYPSLLLVESLPVGQRFFLTQLLSSRQTHLFYLKIRQLACHSMSI